MNRGEELIRKFEEAVIHMTTTYWEYYEREHSPEYKEACKQAQVARKAAIEYVAGIENSLAFIAGAVEGAIEMINPEEDMGCGDFTPEDFNMIEERNTIIDNINNEGFEIFEED